MANCNQSKKAGETNAEADSGHLATLRVAETGVDDPPSMTFKMKLWEKGIDFYARGNEPSWAVDIDLENGMKFTTMDGLTIETNSVEINKTHGADIIRISGGTESTELVIDITEQVCSDTMSDEKFRYAVEMDVKLEGESDYKTFQGCGQYVPDYSLHDIWVLVEANGDAIDSNRFPDKGSPTFEFFVEEGRISGHAGCNNFNGGFYRAEENVLHFEPFVMTRMMCQDMELENLIEKSVAGRRMKYEIKDLKLTLSGYDNTILVFEKIE
jgi:heat shock protein HslJ/uncharacterized membrane protein